MEPMEIKLRTLTPLWTGGAERNSDRVRETGLIGSLRWWYEGILRAMNVRVCDATADDASKRCIFKQEKDQSFEEACEGLCLSCRLFGCTGWQRRFRLEAKGLRPQDLFFVASRSVYQGAGNWLWRMFGGEELGGGKEGRGAAVTFVFGAKALWGEQTTLRVVPLGIDAQDTLARVAFLLDTMAHWGALGAKPQHGFGQIEITGGLPQELIRKGKELIAADTQDGQEKSPPNFFNLVHFFSHIYRLAQLEPYRGTEREIGSPPQKAGSPPTPFDYREHFIPCAFDIRFKSQSKNFRTGQGSDFGMRPWFQERWGKEVAHRLFGRSDARRDDERSAGRISVSHLYREKPDGPWLLKVWGHVPSNLCDSRGNPITTPDVATQVTAFVGTMFGDTEMIDEFDRKEVLGK